MLITGDRKSMKLQRKGACARKIEIYGLILCLFSLLFEPVAVVWAQTATEPASPTFPPLIVQGNGPALDQTIDEQPSSSDWSKPAAGTSILGDRVWNDLNANGVQDIGERGVAGVTVELLTAVAARRWPRQKQQFKWRHLFSTLDAAPYRIQSRLRAALSLPCKIALPMRITIQMWMGVGLVIV